MKSKALRREKSLPSDDFNTLKPVGNLRLFLGKYILTTSVNL